MFTKIGTALVATDRVLAIQPWDTTQIKGVKITFDNDMWLIVEADSKAIEAYLGGLLGPTA